MASFKSWQKTLMCKMKKLFGDCRNPEVDKCRIDSRQGKLIVPLTSFESLVSFDLSRRKTGLVFCKFSADQNLGNGTDRKLFYEPKLLAKTFE